jgi:hypothetical protein
LVDCSGKSETLVADQIDMKATRPSQGDNGRLSLTGIA